MARRQILAEMGYKFEIVVFSQAIYSCCYAMLSMSFGIEFVGIICDWKKKRKEKKESCSLSFAMCGEKYIYCFLSLHNSYIQTMPHSAYRKKNKALFLVKGLRRLIWWCVLDCRHRWEKHQKGKTRRIGNGSSWGKGTVPIEPEFWFFLFLVISHSAKRWISCYSPVTNCSPFLGNRARKR